MGPLELRRRNYVISDEEHGVESETKSQARADPPIFSDVLYSASTMQS